MARNISVTELDLVSQGGERNLYVEANNPDVAGDIRTAVLNYNDLTAAEKTKLDDCLNMLEAKAVQVPTE